MDATAKPVPPADANLGRTKTAEHWLEEFCRLRPGFIEGGNICGCSMEVPQVRCDRCMFLLLLQEVIEHEREQLPRVAANNFLIGQEERDQLKAELERAREALRNYLYEPHSATHDVSNDGKHTYYAGGFCARCGEHYEQGFAALESKPEKNEEESPACGCVLVGCACQHAACGHCDYDESEGELIQCCQCGPAHFPAKKPRRNPKPAPNQGGEDIEL